MRDFQRKQQKNPHPSFARPTKRRRLFFRIGLIAFLVVLYLVNTMPPLRFSRVVVEAATPEGRAALTQASEQFLAERRYWVFSNRALAFFQSNRLEQAIATTLPIDRIAVTPQYRDRAIAVSAIFRTPVALLESPNASVYLDDRGRVLTRTLEPFDATQLLPMKSSVPILDVEHAPVLAAEDMMRYRTLRTALAQRGKPILWLIATGDPDTLDFQMKDDWRLRVTHDDPDSILKRLDIFFAERAKQPKHHPLDFVDLRFGDKIISKEKGV